MNNAEKPEPEVSGLDGAFDWIKENAEDDGSYTIVLDTDTTVTGTRNAAVEAAFHMDNAAVKEKTGVTITLIGFGGERTIQWSSYGRLFHITAPLRFILGNNITLKGGIAWNSLPLVYVDAPGAEFQMLDGSKITGQTYRYAVHIHTGAAFYMKGGKNLREHRRRYFGL